MPDFLSPHRIALIGHAQGAEAQKTVQKFTEISLPSMLFSIIYLVSTCKPDFKDLSGTFSTVIQKGCQVRASTTTTIVAPIQILKQDIPLSSRAPFIILLFQFVKGCTLASSVRPQWGMYAGCQATSTSEYIKVLCIMH